MNEYSVVHEASQSTTVPLITRVGRGGEVHMAIQLNRLLSGEPVLLLALSSIQKQRSKGKR